MTAIHDISAPACAHCGLPVPLGLVEPEAEHQFCCAGCRTVYRFIHSEGFAAYYDLRGEEKAGPAIVSEDAYEAFDDPAFEERYVILRPDGLRQIDLHLEGVHCAACMWLIERALEREDAVAEARLTLARARLRLVWSPECPLSSIARRLAALGYAPHPARLADTDLHHAEERRLWIRIGVAGAVAGNVMLMAFALYGGWMSGMAEEYRRLFRYGSMVASLPAVLYAATPFFRGAYQGLKNRVLHMDLPISLGIGVGFLSGVVNTLRGSGEIYFDSVTALAFLLLVGRLLQLRQQRRASESSELLYALTPSSARRIGPEGEAHSVPLEAIQPGDRIEVHAGERIPTDGVVLKGASSLDMSLLSGESMPVAVGPKDVVFGGTENLEDNLLVRVTHDIRQSRVGKIADMVVEAAEGRTPIVQLADRVAGVFVATVLIVALMTLVVWGLIDPSQAIDHAVALLIVSCPCALGLATPLAVTAAMGKAARRGILVRSGTSLEVLGSARRGRIFFDKTGTLTHGRMEVIAFEGSASVKPWVASAEAGSIHPVGQALFRWAKEVAPIFDAEAIETVVGGGLMATVDGRKIRVGSPAFVGQKCLHDHVWIERTEAWTEEGLTPVWIGVDGRVVAAVGLMDRLRSDAHESVATLQARGFIVEILSGDHPNVVRSVGRSLGLSDTQCHGGLRPEDKQHYIEAARGEDPVIMVGDGVNDAAALAAASVGVAVHGGAETCFAAADVFLKTPGVATLARLIHGSRRTVATIRRNIIFSLAYNMVGASLAVTGHLNPLVAAVLMPLSSLVVVTASFRFRFGED